ncbi:MAG: hypothetical protein GY940_03820 [bacterium]|nr:hypothetical protein [bacterium]
MKDIESYENEVNGEVIYKSEYEILQQLQQAMNDHDLSKEELAEKLNFMCLQYEKLLKTTMKVTKISDTYHKKLMVAKEHAEDKNQELEKALTEIKTLSGLLPICSNCKQIRDEGGAWHQIESFISTHSKAEFSHSLCPQCFKVLYPEYADKI